METVLNCNLCGSQGSFDLSPVGKWKLVCCNNCNLVYLNPRPSIDEGEGTLYPKDYERHWTLERYLQEDKKWSKRLYTGIAEAYSSSRSNFWKKFRFRLFRNHIGGLPTYKKNGFILDVGCADGFFLYLMRDLSWQVKGIEPNQSAANRGREKGLDIFIGDLSEAHLPDDSFDVVRFWHVLEHTRNPKKTLIEAKRILKSGGKLILGVPNIDAPTFKIFKDYNKWHEIWNLPLHFYFYSRATLRNSLKKCGFKNIYIGNHSGGSMRLALEKMSNLSFLTSNKWLSLVWNGMFLIGDFIIEVTGSADSLEAHCQK